MCNDMFDCVSKKSETKEESYYYDYTIKTTQNIENLEKLHVDAVEEDAGSVPWPSSPSPPPFSAKAHTTVSIIASASIKANSFFIVSIPSFII